MYGNSSGVTAGLCASDWKVPVKSDLDKLTRRPFLPPVISPGMFTVSVRYETPRVFVSAFFLNGTGFYSNNICIS